MPPLSTSDGFAHRMLSKMGWKEGEGLGKSKQGVKSFIKVDKRKDGMGLGTEKDIKKDEWHFGAFEEAILSVQHLDTRKKKRKRKEQQWTKADMEEDHILYREMFAKTGGARLGMRARAMQKGKWERTEGGSRVHVVETSTLVEVTCQKESNSSEIITDEKSATESLLSLGGAREEDKAELKKVKRKKAKKEKRKTKKTKNKNKI